MGPARFHCATLLFGGRCSYKLHHILFAQIEVTHRYFTLICTCFSNISIPLYFQEDEIHAKFESEIASKFERGDEIDGDEEQEEEEEEHPVPGPPGATDVAGFCDSAAATVERVREEERGDRAAMMTRAELMQHLWLLVK